MKQYVYLSCMILVCIPGCSWFASSSEGDSITQNRIVADEKNKRIKEIEVNGNFSVVLSSDEHTTVDLQGSEDVLKRVAVSLHDDHLHIDMKTSSKNSVTCYVTIDKDHYSDVEKIKLSGAADFKTHYPIGREALRIEASGSCKIHTGVDVEKLEIKGEGSSKFDIDGQALYQNVDLSGASSYHAGSLMTETAQIEGSGSTRFMMNVSDRIKGKLVGASILSYRGTPKINVKTSGASSVNKVD